TVKDREIGVPKLKQGSFCVGKVVPPEVCSPNLSGTGASVYVDLEAPGTGDNYHGKKLKLVVDEPLDWETNCKLKIHTNNGLLHEIVKTDILDNLFEIDLPDNSTYVSFQVESPSTTGITKC